MNACLRSPCFLLACLLSFTSAQARILNVPQDYGTIQAGIDAHQADDTLLVQPGIYQENIDCHGGTLTIGSLTLMNDDPAYVDSTIIDGGGAGTVLDVGRTIGMDRGASFTLRGFTIRNGALNHEDRYASGLLLAASTISLADVIVTQNSGMAVFDAGVTNLNMTRVKISDNDNLGFWTSAAYVNITDCDISRNRLGGARFIVWQLTMHNVSVCDNSGASGLWFSTGDRQPFDLDHITISGTRGEEGVGLSVGGGTLINIRNSIIYNNESFEVALTGAGTALQVFYSDVPQIEQEVSIDEETQLTWDDGNLDSDPFFVDPANEDYHLSPNSPCIDAGDPDSPPDADSSRADMGAFPFDHRPDIAIIPQDLTFPMIGWGELDSLPVAIINQGGTALHITQITPPNFLTCIFVRLDSSVFDPPIEIAPDSSMTLWVYIQPDSGAEFIRTDILIVSDDPDEPEIHVTAHGEWPNGVAGSPLTPYTLHLDPCFPNPFNASTTIRFALKEDSKARLTVYDLSGRETATLVNGDLIAGSHTATWNAEGFASGIYLVKMETPGFNAIRKMTLVK